MSEVKTSDAMGCAECRRQLADSQALCRELASTLRRVVAQTRVSPRLQSQDRVRLCQTEADRIDALCARALGDGKG